MKYTLDIPFLSIQLHYVNHLICFCRFSTDRENDIARLGGLYTDRNARFNR